MKKITVLLFLLLIAVTLKAQSVKEFPELKNPHPIAVDGNDLFIVDEEYKIKVYSIDPFKLKYSFGSKGDGATDIKYPARIYIYPDKIVVTDFSKSLYFSRTGEFVKVKNYSDFEDFDTGMEMLLLPVKENYVRITVDHDKERRKVSLYDSEFKKIKQLHEGSFNWKADDGFNPFSHRIYTVCHEDKIFISDSERGFFINVFDFQGNHLRTIDHNRNMDKVRISEIDKGKIIDEIRLTQPDWVYKQIKDNPKFSDFYHLLHHFQVSGDKIYVTTYKEKDGKSEIVILDFKGNILKRTFMKIESKKRYRRILRFDLFAVNNSILYEVSKNEKSGKWEFLESLIK